MRLRHTMILAVVLAMLAAATLSPVAHGASGRGDYIVVLKDSVSSPAAVAKAHKKKHGAQVKRVYRKILGGYAATLDKKDLKALRKDPKVAFVERDRVARIAKKGGNRPGGGGGGGGVGSWGLDRIDQRDLPLNDSYSVDKTGQGVRVYVLDTGVRVSHREFGGRAISGMDFISNDTDASDCHGHGTHVAGTVAGATYGVAKKATIVAVRVLNCAGAGSWSGIIDGLEWAVANAPKESGAKDAKVVRSVVNMSIGGPRSSAMEAAIADATELGMTVVVAAGNEATDACNRSPAAAPSAITVGATTSSDRWASFSNYGGCVDIQAPGVSIKSAWRTRDNATKTSSGTSMAAPHVAGVAALHLQGNGFVGANALSSSLVSDSSRGKLSGVPGSTDNYLLWVK